MNTSLRNGELRLLDLRDIAQIEELLITCEADHILFASKDVRYRMLQDTYMFLCNCTACQFLNPSVDSREAIVDHMGRAKAQELISGDPTTVIPLYI